MHSKLYIVTRSDLSPGLQLAQSVHAMRAFTALHPELDQKWYTESNNVVCLAAKDEAELARLVHTALRNRVTTATFTEPDLDGALTGVALYGDQAHRLTSNFPLALKEKIPEAAPNSPGEAACPPLQTSATSQMI